MTSLVFTKSGTDYNSAKDFGQVNLENIDMEYQALELSVSTNDNIKKLKYRGFYTLLFNSNNE